MRLRPIFVFLCFALAPMSCRSQATAFTGRARVERSAGSTARDASGVVVWLTPLSQANAVASARPGARPLPQLVQTEKHFEPHLLVVPVGTLVEFPNKDPFFHNVFSLFEGKR